MMRTVTTLAFAAALIVAPCANAQTSGSLEEGLQSLARNIVARSKDAERNKIAILPFANADGSCSVLSTYIVDELVLSLFSVPNSPLKLIERSQLDALIEELKLGQSGPLDPKTTRELGKISGVDALVIGSNTILGDRVRINARLIGTDTGETFSAAAMNVPRTDTLEELMAQPAIAGPTCGGRSVGECDQSTPQQQGSHQREQSVSPFENDFLRASLVSVDRTDDKKKIILTVSFTNKTEEEIFIGFARDARYMELEKDKPVPKVEPKKFLLDNNGYRWRLERPALGIKTVCPEPFAYDDLTPLPSEASTDVVMTFIPVEDSSGKIFTFSAELYSSRTDGRKQNFSISLKGIRVSAC